MHEEPLERIAPPIIRGMTHDGETGLIVTRLSQSTGELMMHRPCQSDSLKEVVQQWTETYRSYIERHRSFPPTIFIEKEDWAMGLGTTIDEARAARGVSKSPFEKGSSDRCAIMKRKISLVTGAAQGFGEGIAEGLAKEGCFVYVTDRNKEGAQKVAERLNSTYGSPVAHALYVDVTDEQSVQAMMDSVASLTGGLDLFVSNAGVLKAGSVQQMTLKDFQFVTQVDYVGFFICSKFASRQLSLQHLGSGRQYMTDIVTISSKSGLEGSNKNGAYAGAKFGTIGLTQSFALELAADQIKVNAICPGNYLEGPLWSDPENGLFVQYLQAQKVPGAKTVEDVQRYYEAKVPLGRGCRPQDVVRAICYAVEQKYETGQAIPVTGGQVMLN